MITLPTNLLSSLALAVTVVPFIGALLIALSPRNAAKWICQIFSACAVILVLLVAWLFARGGSVEGHAVLIGFGHTEIMGLILDRVSTLVAVAVVGIGYLIALYSIGYLNEGNREHPDIGRRRFYAFLLVFIGAMGGIVFTSTVIGQLVFFEITGACSWALIGYYESPKALRAAAKALIVTHVASIGLYVAAALLFVDTGTFAVSAIANLTMPQKTIVLFAIMFAAWGKSAQVPFHEWLPSAMEAPTPVSAYLHAASMVKVGVYIFARGLLSSGGAPEIIGWIGAVMATITLIYGFAMYLPQVDMKRLLAYSTITQLGTIMLGLSLSVFGSELAYKGAVAHIFNHAFGKTLFFLIAGALSYTAGTRLMPQLRGLINKKPLLGIGFAAAAMAIAGVPPFSGFFSKFAIFAGGIEVARGHWFLMVLVIIGLIESVCTFAWLLKWMGYCVPGKPSETIEKAGPTPVSIQIVVVVLIIMSVCSSFIAAWWLG